MTDPKRKDPGQVLDELIYFADVSDDSSSDATEELRAAGVNIDAFMAEVSARILQVEDEDRLAWLRAAREKGAWSEPNSRTAKYAGFSHHELVGHVRKREVAGGQASAFFYKLDRLTEEDLRTLLEDLDDLDDGSEE